VDLKFSIEIECEEDGRWLADVTDLPGVMSYGQTAQEAVQRASHWPASKAKRVERGVRSLERVAEAGDEGPAFVAVGGVEACEEGAGDVVAHAGADG
jgi:hypothetical protein